MPANRTHEMVVVRSSGVINGFVQRRIVRAFAYGSEVDVRGLIPRCVNQRGRPFTMTAYEQYVVTQFTDESVLIGGMIYDERLGSQMDWYIARPLAPASIRIDLPRVAREVRSLLERESTPRVERPPNAPDDWEPSEV